MREDHGLLDLLTANYTFINERLARHYGIPERLRQPLPPRRAARRRRAARSARPGQHPDRDLVRAPHLSRDPRQVAARKCPRRAAATAARQRAGADGERRGQAAAVGARAARDAPEESGVRELPCAAWTRSASRWRTSTRSAGGGRWTRGRPIDASGDAARRHQVRGGRRRRARWCWRVPNSSSGRSPRSC